MSNTIIPVCPMACNGCLYAYNPDDGSLSFPERDNQNTWICVESIAAGPERRSTLVVRGESTVPAWCHRKILHEVALLKELGLPTPTLSLKDYADE